MTTVEINENKVTETITPNYLQQIFGYKVKVNTYTILDRSFSNFPAYPVLMNSEGKIISPLSKIAELVQNKANLLKYGN